MADRIRISNWMRDFSEAMEYGRGLVQSLWRNELLPLLTSIGIFLVMAAPMIGVIAVLWYLDSIGWRASPGFYTIAP